jgi:hypothetical protein
MCNEEINILKLPHAVWQSFLSISPHLSGGTMATSQRYCHLPGEMLNSDAECADRAQIVLYIVQGNHTSKNAYINRICLYVSVFTLIIWTVNDYRVLIF